MIKKNWLRKTFVLGVIAGLLALASCDTLPEEEVEVEEEELPPSDGIVTEYNALWSSTINVKAGEYVKWYVHAESPSGCDGTIKIPGVGWGTDDSDDSQGHTMLVEGYNFVYTFTPEQLASVGGEIQFCCWMGQECHENFIHIVAE